MRSIRRVAAGSLVVAVLVIACQKKETGPPQPQAASPAAPRQAMPTDVPPISGTAPTVIPDSLKGKWRAVKLLVEDKKTNQSKEYVVNLGAELAIPSSTLVVKVEEFLPDLKIEETKFTTASSELKNPAVHVKILENGKEIFNGWLFQLFPAVHPFQNEEFSIILRDSVAAS